jgi:hypothetical protein
MLLNKSAIANIKKLEKQYTLLAYERPELLAFTKLLMAFVVYKEGNKVSATLYNKILTWYSTSIPLQKEVKIDKPIKTIMNFISQHKQIIPDKSFNAYLNLLRALRLALFAKEAKKNRAALLETFQITGPIKNLINSVFTLINKDSDNAYNNITRNISILKDPELSGFFTAITDETGAKVVKDYLKVIKSLTGTNAEYLDRDFTLNRLPKLPQSKQDEYKKASSLERAAYKKALFNIIRQSGEPLIDADELREKLHDEGMLTFRIPVGFTGKYDDKANMYLSDGRQLNSNQSGGHMTMLPEKEGVAKVAHGQGILDQGSKDYQTTETKQKNANKKFELVNSLIPRIAEIAQNWRTDFVFETNLNKLYGALAETLYITAGRVGDIKREVGGIYNLKAKNLTVLSNGIKIAYIGKDSINQSHIIKASPENEVGQLLVTFLTTLKATKKPDDFLWSLKGSTVTIDGFRNYLKSIGFNASPHKFRHIKGTTNFIALLNKNPIPKDATATDVANHIKNILTVIGQQLGHITTNKKTGAQDPQWSTAIKNYVDPKVVMDIYKERNMTLPSWVPRIPEKDE